MIKGDRVSLRLLEKRDVGYLHAWLIDPDFIGPYEAPHHVTEQELEKTYLRLTDERWWFILKQSRTRVGFLTNRLREYGQEIKLYITPEERGNGYASEAVKLIVDHLFLNQAIQRVQAVTSIENTAMCRVLNKNRFISEGIIRRNRFHKGTWKNSSLYSLIRPEWNDPTRTPTRKYYTNEYPSGPWSRALHEKITGKPFDENEFRKTFEQA